jgi:phage terminase Nu1 subunit (DNA packaging protein)
MDRLTITQRLAEAGEEVGEDGLFSTVQLIAALTGGDIHKERLRETRARARNLELRNQEKEGKSLNAEQVHECISRFVATVKHELLASSLNEHEKRSLLIHLSEFRAPGQTG